MFVDAPDFFATGLGVDRIDWSWDEPASSSASAYTGKRSIAVDPWYSIAKAHVQFSPIGDDAGIRAMRSFLRRCRGQTNHFRMFATIGVQNDNAGVTVAVAATAGARTLKLAGYATPLLDGQFATVNGQLLELVGDQAGDWITFEPMLRQDVAAGTFIQTARPYALVYLASSSNGYSVGGPGTSYQVAIDVVEAIREADVFELDDCDTTFLTCDETTISMDEAA